MNNWPTKRLGEITTYFNDGNWIESEDQSVDGIRLIQTGNIGLGYFIDKRNKSRYINEKTFENLKCTEVFEGDILISRLPDPVGRSCLLPRLDTRMITAVDCTIARFPTKSLAKYFLYYSLTGKYLNEVEKYLTGSSRIRISKSNLVKVDVGLPPTITQKKIVERLDAIRKAQEFCDAQISKTEELFESILTSELDSKNSWNIKRLNDICDVRDGTHDSPKYHTSGIPLVTSKNLKDGEIDFINVNYISVEDHNKIIKRSLVEKGDILYGMIGTIGNPVIVNTDTVFSIKNVGLIKFNKSNINNYFVKYFLHSRRLNNQITKMSRGGTQKFVSLGNLRNLEIPIPTKDKQKKIVAKLNIVQGYKKLLFKQKTLLKELFDSVLYKSMNGEMDR